MAASFEGALLFTYVNIVLSCGDDVFAYGQLSWLSSHEVMIEGLALAFEVSLNPKLLPVGIAACCIAAATHWWMSAWVNERPL